MPEPCPLCKSADVRIRYQLTGYRIAICARCGFEYHDGFQGGGGDEGMFSENYYRCRHHDAFDAQFGDYTRDPSAGVYARWLDRIEEKTGRGHMLDVGSALGTFLAIARARGWTTHGVEISRFAADFAREKRGLAVFNGDLAQFPGEDARFDAVTFWDSIEHVTHPVENLTTAIRLLRRGGIMLLTTDNFDCLVADVARIAYRASLGRLRYPMERVFIAPNRSFFTEARLGRLLEGRGLRIVACEKMEYPLDKIRTNWAERWILRGFYAAAHLIHREAQVTVLAEKP